jgi:hypothetical protein
MSLRKPHDPGDWLPRRRPAQSSRDLELRLRILNCRSDAVEAALTLMERHEPGSLPQALDLLGEASPITPSRFEIVAEAWDRYFHIRSMPWD